MLGQRSPAVNSSGNNEIKEEENGMGVGGRAVVPASSSPTRDPWRGLQVLAAGVSALLRAEAHLESSSPALGSFIAASAAAAAAASASAFPAAAGE